MPLEKPYGYYRIRHHVAHCVTNSVSAERAAVLFLVFYRITSCFPREYHINLTFPTILLTERVWKIKHAKREKRDHFLIKIFNKKLMYLSGHVNIMLCCTIFTLYQIILFVKAIENNKKHMFLILSCSLVLFSVALTF